MIEELNSLSRRILESVRQSPGCTLEDITTRCPELTWCDIFREVDRLSRLGIITLTVKGGGVYEVALSTAGLSSGG